MKYAKMNRANMSRFEIMQAKKKQKETNTECENDEFVDTIKLEREVNDDDIDDDESIKRYLADTMDIEWENDYFVDTYKHLRDYISKPLDIVIKVESEMNDDEINASKSTKRYLADMMLPSIGPINLAKLQKTYELQKIYEERDFFHIKSASKFY